MTVAPRSSPTTLWTASTTPTFGARLKPTHPRCIVTSCVFRVMRCCLITKRASELIALQIHVKLGAVALVEGAHMPTTPLHFNFHWHNVLAKCCTPARVGLSQCTLDPPTGNAVSSVSIVNCEDHFQDWTAWGHCKSYASKSRTATVYARESKSSKKLARFNR